MKIKLWNKFTLYCSPEATEVALCCTANGYCGIMKLPPTSVFIKSLIRHHFFSISMNNWITWITDIHEERLYLHFLTSRYCRLPEAIRYTQGHCNLEVVSCGLGFSRNCVTRFLSPTSMIPCWGKWELVRCFLIRISRKKEKGIITWNFNIH